MKKSCKAKIRGLTKAQFAHLQKLCNHAKNLYNQALWNIRKEWQENGSYLDYYVMDKVMKKTVNLEGAVNYHLLKAGVSQQILRKLDCNWKAFFAAIADWKISPFKYRGKPKFPNFIREKYYPLIFDAQRFQIHGDFAKLDELISIKIPGQLSDKNIKQIQIIPRFHYFEAVFIYEDSSLLPQVTPNERKMAIDLGLNNLAVCVTNGVIPPFVISGRPLKSINQFYNKMLAFYQPILKTRNSLHWSKRLQALTDRRNKQINDYLHKASRKIVNVCLANDISQVIIGNVARSNYKIHIGKTNNQNFVNISLGQFVDKVVYKLEAHSITSKVADESYTSKSSFLDDDLLPAKYAPDATYSFKGVRIKRGLYKSQNKTLINADVNGAYNILRKETPNFTFSTLFSKIKNGVVGWLHPYCKLLIRQLSSIKM